MKGIFVEVFTPIVKGAQYLFQIQRFSGYSHNIAAIGGFWDASLALSLQQSKAEDWYENGLGRQVRVRNHLGGIVWKGFVNKITITAGSQILSRGPLLDVTNRASATYTPRNFDVYPPTDGTTTTTILTEDLNSQREYGILEKSVNAGTTTEINALKVRNVFLASNRLPKTTGDFTISGIGQVVSMNLELLGNVHWLTVYPYNNFVGLLITVYDKLIQVLDANTPINPGVISTDYQFIEANTYAMEQLEDKNRFAWDIANEIISLGNDTNDKRRTFGIYEDDMAVYSQTPSFIDYEYRLSAQKQMVKDFNKNVMVYPWDIRPGKWIHTADWMIGRIVKSTDLFEDPRNKFIENVSFTAPYTVGITGSPYDKLSQMLSKITYTGGIY